MPRPRNKLLGAEETFSSHLALVCLKRRRAKTPVRLRRGLAIIWRSYEEGRGAGALDVFAFMTTQPNKLVATVHPSRMPVLLASPEVHDVWLNGIPEAAYDLVESYPADQMEIVQSGSDRKDLG